MLAPKVFALEFFKVGKHRTVGHMVSVDHKIVGRLLHIAILLHIGTAIGEEEMLQLLATDGMLVKRPMLVGDDFVLVGFKESAWAEQLSADVKN